MRYVVVHDDRLPTPVKELMFALEDDTVYTYATMRLANMLLKMDEAIADPEHAEEHLREED